MARSKYTHTYTWERERERGLTTTPNTVLRKNKYKKLPTNCKIILELIWDRSKLWIALKSTTDVASFTTPSPKTRLYSRGVSSWLSTCKSRREHYALRIVFTWDKTTALKRLLYLQGANRICCRKDSSNCCEQLSKKEELGNKLCKRRI